MARLQEQYVNEIAPALNKKFGYKSVRIDEQSHQTALPCRGGAVFLLSGFLFSSAQHILNGHYMS